jgi:putative heme-binding domain-containing protein
LALRIRLTVSWERAISTGYLDEDLFMAIMRRLSWSTAIVTIVTGFCIRAAVAQTRSLEARLLRGGAEALAEEVRAEGDPVQGAVLFYQPQLSCTKCHTCGANEGESPLGPDLARPQSETTDVDIVESLLEPSKKIRKGHESLTVLRTDGTVVSGLLVEDRSDALVLRDAKAGGELVTIAKEHVEEFTVEAVSMMPSGLVNQLADRQQFLDLAAFLMECAEFGPA